MEIGNYPQSTSVSVKVRDEIAVLKVDHGWKEARACSSLEAVLCCVRLVY